MRTPFGWLLGIAAIVAAARVSVAKEEPGEIVARRIVIQGGGDASIELSADENGCSMKLRRGKWGEVQVSLNEDGASLWMVPTSSTEDPPSVTLTATPEEARVKLSTGNSVPPSPMTPSTIIVANRKYATASANVYAGSTVGSLVVGSREGEDSGGINFGPFDYLKAREKKFEDLMETGEGNWHPSGFALGFNSMEGTYLSAFDSKGMRGVEIDCSTQDTEPDPAFTFYGKDGKAVGSLPASPADPAPAYVPTFQAVQPPASPASNATPEALKVLEEWHNAHQAAYKAARLAASLVKIGGGPRDRSFLDALTSRDNALKACAVLKRRYEEALQAGR